MGLTLVEPLAATAPTPLSIETEVAFVLLQDNVLERPCGIVVGLADNVTVGKLAVPVPVRVTFCGLVNALSVTVKVPVWLPATTGANFTPMVQVAPELFRLVQLFWLIEKSPVTVAPVNVTASVPPLVNVTVLAALVEPTAWFPKARLDGVNVTVAFFTLNVAVTTSVVPVVSFTAWVIVCDALLTWVVFQGFPFELGVLLTLLMKS